MAMSDCETLGGKMKKKVQGHSQPGTSSTNIDEALGGAAKKMTPPAHVGHKSTSHEDEALGGMAKKREMADMSSAHSQAGDAAKHIK
jgi:hypothetical protein